MKYLLNVVFYIIDLQTPTPGFSSRIHNAIRQTGD